MASPLALPNILLDLYNPIIITHPSHLSTSTSSTSLEKGPSPFSFFFPDFQEKDQVLIAFNQAGICDELGNPYEQFNELKMPSLPLSKVTKNSFQTIRHFLEKMRQLDTPFLEEKGSSRQLNISLQYAHFFQHLIQLSSYPRVSFKDRGAIQTKESFLFKIFNLLEVVP